jgi:hypothetical protein
MEGPASQSITLLPRDIYETNILLCEKIQYRRRKIANQCYKKSFRILTQLPLVIEISLVVIPQSYRVDEDGLEGRH